MNKQRGKYEIDTPHGGKFTRQERNIDEKFAIWWTIEWRGCGYRSCRHVGYTDTPEMICQNEYFVSG